MEYQILIFLSLHGGIFISVGLCYIHFKYNAVYFIKESNSLTVIKKSLFNRKKKIIYKAGELEKVKFDYINKCNNSIIIILTNGNQDDILSLTNKK